MDLDDRAVFVHDAEVALPALSREQRAPDLVDGRCVDWLGREVGGRSSFELLGAAPVERLTVRVGVEHGAVEARDDHGRTDAIEQPGLDADEPVRGKTPRRSAETIGADVAYDPLRYGRGRGNLRMDGRLECEIGGIAADGPRLVKVQGEVDLATAPDLEATVRKVLDDAPRGVDLDLRDLTFIDSSGLRSLVAVSKDASAAGFRWRYGTSHGMRSASSS